MRPNLAKPSTPNPLPARPHSAAGAAAKAARTAAPAAGSPRPEEEDEARSDSVWAPTWVSVIGWGSWDLFELISIFDQLKPNIAKKFFSEVGLKCEPRNPSPNSFFLTGFKLTWVLNAD